MKRQKKIIINKFLIEEESVELATVQVLGCKDNNWIFFFVVVWLFFCLFLFLFAYIYIVLIINIFQRNYKLTLC